MVFGSKEKQNVKLYNRMYYQHNKSRIAEGILKKEMCGTCKRVVNHQNMPKHKRSKLCRNTAAKGAVDLY